MREGGGIGQREGAGREEGREEAGEGGAGREGGREGGGNGICCGQARREVMLFCNQVYVGVSPHVVFSLFLEC